MKTDGWESFKVVTDRTEADRIAALLESSGIAAYVDHGALGVGLEGSYTIFVARHLVHRARQVTADAHVTDEELDFLATGKPPNSDG
jgi:hypothetical protein